MAVLCAFAAILTSCHKDILNDIDDLETRVDSLETICSRLNSNVVALQTLVEAQNDNAMISSINAIEQNGIIVGYSIALTNGKTISLYNGANGKNGVDGQDGIDGATAHTPAIGVAKDVDGIYYWTLDGEFLKDNNGEKLPVDGAKGDKGQQGEQGADGNVGEQGEQGTDGKNGVVPQFKIEAGNWFISYDGENWTNIGQATGESGDAGTQGDAIFSDITTDSENVYFNLANGTVITLKKYDGIDYYTVTYNANGGTGTMDVEQISDLKTYVVSRCLFVRDHFEFIEWNTKADGTGVAFAADEEIVLTQNLTLYAQWGKTTSGYFSVSETLKVKFSLGNLQYHAASETWRFAEHQYDYVGNDNKNMSNNYDGWIDLFGWGTGQNPTFADQDGKKYSFSDWGANIVSGYPANTWRTLNYAEYKYLFSTRENATSLYGFCTIQNGADSIKGILILPDNWELPVGITFNAGWSVWDNNVYSLDQWAQMENAGAIFLPAAGRRNSLNRIEVYRVQENGYYWSSTNFLDDSARALAFESGEIDPIAQPTRYYGCSVRLAKNL